MTHAQRVTVALVVAGCLALAALMVAAWPATGAPGPVATPSTYGPPGPTGGPQ
jgi:hypothetical protein